MHCDRCYFCLTSNRSKTLYTGITGKLAKHVFPHKSHTFEGFTSRYNLDRLVYYERFVGSFSDCSGRNKSKAKGLMRVMKLQLIGQ